MTLEITFYIFTDVATILYRVCLVGCITIRMSIL